MIKTTKLTMAFTFASMVTWCSFNSSGCSARSDGESWKEADLQRKSEIQISKNRHLVGQALLEFIPSIEGVVKDKIQLKNDDTYFGYARKYAVGTKGDVCLGSVDVRMSERIAAITFTLYPILESGPRSGKFVEKGDLHEVYRAWDREIKLLSRVILGRAAL